MNAEAREHRIAVRLGPTELAMLETLAGREGQTLSDWIRYTIRRTYAETYGTKAPKRSPDR